MARLLACRGMAFVTEEAEWLEIELKYAGYLDRERVAARRLGEMEGFALPHDLAYREIEIMSWEAREKLAQVRPATLGQAGRVPGVNPSDLHGLLLTVMRRNAAPATT